MARRFGSSQKADHAGEVRQSQLIHTFGIGSIVDFVRDTVIIGGVDNWDAGKSADERKIFNENLQAMTGADYFLTPKTAVNGLFNYKSQDVESYIFPRKLYCPICKHIIDANELRNQTQKHNCFMPNTNKEGKPCGGALIASRFILVCKNGHMEDFPYSWWAHGGAECEKAKHPHIQLYNVRDRSDIDSLRVRCADCGADRGMRGAFGTHYPCQGHHPHLGPEYREDCAEIMSLRLRASSSVYFPAVRGALAIPPWSRRAVHLVEAEYETLASFDKYGGDPAVTEHIKKKILPKAKGPITFTDLASAFKLIKDQKTSPSIRTEADVFAAEYDVLCRGSTDEEEYTASSARIPDGFAEFFESVTSVDKLTVINALVGFTRIEPLHGSLEKNTENDYERKRLAPLSAGKKPWLPAVKLLGEGIFFKFSKNALQAWSSRASGRYDSMRHKLDSSLYINPRFSAQYVALHTFAHLLIRQLADECGYSVSSMQEKIYSTFPGRPEMRGVLIYLATSDAEGSLGGLTSIAQAPGHLKAVLVNMLRKSAWCSADPLCGDSTKQGVYSLNYAACHECVLLPETSCEFHNLLLDRVAIVGKPESPELGLMGKMTMNLL